MTRLIIWLLFIEMLIYNILDAWHTKLLFSMGAYEVNPIMKWVICETGTVNSVFAVKISLFLVLGLFLLKYQSSFR